MVFMVKLVLKFIMSLSLQLYITVTLSNFYLRACNYVVTCMYLFKKNKVQTNKITFIFDKHLDFGMVSVIYLIHHTLIQ